MKEFWKTARLWIFALGVGFYTTFVLQSLWNWFVVTTLHVTPIDYWQMYGLSMLIHMVFERNTFVEEDHWTRALTMLYACIPQERKLEMDEALKQQNENVWGKAGAKVFEKLFGNTVTLGIGWAVHTFFV